MSSEPRNIVIVGAGYAGIAGYLELAKKNFKDPNVRILLISQANFFYHNIAAPRALVQENIIPDICIPLDRLVSNKNSRFIHGEILVFI